SFFNFFSPISIFFAWYNKDCAFICTFSVLISVNEFSISLIISSKRLFLITFTVSFVILIPPINYSFLVHTECIGMMFLLLLICCYVLRSMYVRCSISLRFL